MVPRQYLSVQLLRWERIHAARIGIMLDGCEDPTMPLNSFNRIWLGSRQSNGRILLLSRGYFNFLAPRGHVSIAQGSRGHIIMTVDRWCGFSNASMQVPLFSTYLRAPLGFWTFTFFVYYFFNIGLFIFCFSFNYSFNLCSFEHIKIIFH